MKARRFFAFVAGAAMLFGGVACTPDNGDEADSTYAEITVSPANFATTLEGSTETLAVTSNTDWVVSCDQTDVVIDPVSGKGNGTVTVTIPSVEAPRNFVIKFKASKMISVEGVSVPDTEVFDVQVSQNESGVDMNDYVYYENCGNDYVEQVDGKWPFVYDYTLWAPQGAGQEGVVYSGKNASVRANNSSQYGPTEDALGVSDKPYVFLNKTPAEAYFVIENIAIAGGKNYTFTYNASCQISYVNSTPAFADITSSLIHLQLGYDGEEWADVDLTITPNGGNGWHKVEAAFKVKADATKLYARFTYEAPAENGGCRIDDFKLVEGGNGAELVVKEIPIDQGGDGTAEVTIPYAETFANGIGTDFYVNNVELGGLKYVWLHDATYKCMKASGYDNGAVDTESWLISPSIDLTSAVDPELQFQHCHKFAGDPSKELTLWISTDNAASWTELTIPTYGTNNDYNFVANTISLKSYVGNKVKIAFKYDSTTSDGATWEVKDFQVAEKVEDTPNTFEAGQFVKVTSAPADWSGKYLIVFDGNAHATLSGKDLVATVSGLTITNDAIVNTEAINAAAVRVTASGSNYTIKFDNGMYFANAKNSCASSTIPFEWTIEQTSAGAKLANAVPDASNNDAIYILYKNAGGPYYRCYVEKNQSDYTLPTLYKFYASGETPEQPETPDTPVTPEQPVVTIADITTAGTYSVNNAWAVATYANGALLTDASGAYILAYKPTTAVAVGEKVNIEGAVSSFGGLLQFGEGATTTKTGETVTVTNPTPEVLDAAKVDALVGAIQIKYVEYEGTLSISNSKYYNVTIAGTSNQGSVQYPTDDLKATLTALDGKYIKVTGYTIGVSSSKYLNTMATSVVETTAPETPENPGGDTPETPETPEVPADGLVLASSDIATVVQSGTYKLTNGTEQKVDNDETWFNVTANGVSFTGCRVMINNNKDPYKTHMQFQGDASDVAKQGFLGNALAYNDKEIEKIVVETISSYDTPSFNIYYGTEKLPNTNAIATTADNCVKGASAGMDGSYEAFAFTCTFDIPAGNKFFALRNDSKGATYVKSITIVFKK